MSVALIDADVVAYQVAVRNQEDFDWGDTGSSRVVHHERARQSADETIAELCSAAGCDTAVVCLSDPNRNWRKELEPTYKGNRKESEKPELLLWAKQYLENEYRSAWRPRLEGDDVMGIMSTSPTALKSVRTVIVSVDKDMRTIPGLLYNPNQPDLGVIEVSELDADRFHMWQTLVGDTTDGYPGCPGIGKSSEFADEVIGADRDELWDIVLHAYAVKGLTEDDAIHQARLARILRFGEYCSKTQKVRLWNPTRLFT